MGKLKCKSDYEDLRSARILENQARLESLGIHKTLSDLRSLTSSSPKCERRKWTKRVYETAILRRSDRLKRISSVESSTQYSNNLSLRRSNRLKEISTEPVKAVVRRKVEVRDESEEEEDEKRSANAPLVKVKGVMQIQLSPEASARRCSSKGRGTIYNSVFGICCHFCRQKTLCSEEDCKRCSNLDPDEPCIGKTDCSLCHSPTGVFCRGCLEVRYGEDIEEVRENKKWMCPHCVEERGTNPYWICNRQKTLCSEEDCKRCSNLDPDEPCIGKTDCSFCHSPTGVFFRGCLEVRYGEDIEEVRENKKWMCPHCVEERGTNPYWICNSYE